VLRNSPDRSDLYPRQFRLGLDKIRDKLLAELKKYSGNYAFQVRRFDFLNGDGIPKNYNSSAPEGYGIEQWPGSSNELNG
jgi:hypothetical protein